jgi:hypothetical protein
MTDDPRGRTDGREPMASVEQLNAAIEALGVKRGDGPLMPRAQALGALLFLAEQLRMFDTDRVDVSAVRSGYVNMALMAGMMMEGEQMPAGAVVPGREFTDELWEAATFAFGRLIEDRLKSTLLDLEEMMTPGPPGSVNIASPLLEWLRAICALAPFVNVADVAPADVLKAAKAAKGHAAVGRQHLADVIRVASKEA